MTDRLSRRRMLQQSAKAVAAVAGGAAYAVSPTSRAAEETPATEGPKVAAFTKSFQAWSVPEVCRKFRGIGLDGLDLTVRPGGHIEPKDAPRELPRAAAAARKAGTEILFLTTAITDPDDEADRLLGAAAEIGIDRVKLGYYRYQGFGNLEQQMAEVRRRLEAVSRLAAKHGVLPCVHIHSDAFIPSHGTQLYQLLQGLRPDDIGAYVDTLHMVKEGGGDGWRQGLDLLGPWIALVAVKNFVWERGQRDRYGQLRWQAQKVPLADGVSPLPEFVSALKELGYAGTYSLHSEYQGRRSFQDLDATGCLRQTAEDLKYFRTLL